MKLNMTSLGNGKGIPCIIPFFIILYVPILLVCVMTKSLLLKRIIYFLHTKKNKTTSV